MTGSKRRRRKLRRPNPERMTYIGSQVIYEPAWAKAEILESVERSRGRLISAAIELGVERRQLQRYCWQLGLWPEVDAIRERWRLGLADTPVLRLLRRQPGLTPAGRAIIGEHAVQRERLRSVG